MYNSALEGIELASSKTADKSRKWWQKALNALSFGFAYKPPRDTSKEQQKAKEEWEKRLGAPKTPDRIVPPNW